MNDHDRYVFDLQGYLVIPNALSKSEVAALNALWDEHIAGEMKPDERTHRWKGLLKWGKPFRDLIDHSSILPHLEALCGSAVRLDHEYCDLIRAGKGPIGTTLHGGGTPYDELCYYHYRDGRIRGGLVAVGINLMDVNPGDGGFGCVPGSHKSNVPYPDEWRELETAPPFVERVTGPAGTAIIFTEALTHGTLPWTGKTERRTLFYKYSPSVSSWAQDFYNAGDYPDLTAQQRSMLESPNWRYAQRRLPN